MCFRACLRVSPFKIFADSILLHKNFVKPSRVEKLLVNRKFSSNQVGLKNNWWIVQIQIYSKLWALRLCINTMRFWTNLENSWEWLMKLYIYLKLRPNVPYAWAYGTCDWPLWSYILSKHKEGLRTLAETKCQMSCSDFTNFLIMAKFAISTMKLCVLYHNFSKGVD